MPANDLSPCTLRISASSVRSLWLSAGVHPKIVQGLLCHANIAMMMDIYSDALPSMQAEPAEKVAEPIRAAG